MNETNKKWKRERENAKLTTRRGMRLRKALFPVLSAWILIDLFIMVFLPMRTTESPRRPLRIFCSWVDPTLSAATIRIWLYSSSSWHSLESYAIFLSAFDGLCTIVTMEMKIDVLGFLRLKWKNLRENEQNRGPRRSSVLGQGGQRSGAVSLTSDSSKSFRVWGGFLK